MVEPSRKLPVFRKGEVVGWTLVDADVYEWAQDLRWRLGGRGYAVSGNRKRGHDWRTGGEAILHREVLGLRHGDPRESDHINRNRLDNRRANLRVVTRQQNTENREISTPTTSIYRGVARHPAGSWQVQVMVAGAAHKLGSYLCEHIAGIVAERGRRELMTHAQPSRAIRDAGLGRFVDSDGRLACACGATTVLRRARYWRLVDSKPLCKECHGYTPPRRGSPRLPLRPCGHCGRKTDHLRGGRCGTCYGYVKRHGVDRPAELVAATAGRPFNERRESAELRGCAHCKRDVNKLTLGRCAACYRYLRIHGVDRPAELLDRLVVA